MHSGPCPTGDRISFALGLGKSGNRETRWRFSPGDTYLELAHENPDLAVAPPKWPSPCDMVLAAPPRDAAVRVHHGPRSAEITCFAVHQIVTGFFQNRVHLAVQVTSAGEPFPYRRSPMLHRSHMGFGGAAMLNEDNPAVRFQYASDFI